MLKRLLLAVLILAAAVANALAIPHSRTLRLAPSPEEWLSDRGTNQETITAIAKGLRGLEEACNDAGRGKDERERGRSEPRRRTMERRSMSMIGSPTSTITASGPTASATPFSKPPQDTIPYRVQAKVFDSIAGLIDWTVPLVIATFSATAISRLYRDGNDTGLMAGAGAAGGVFTLVQTDSTTTMPLLISLVLVYLSFHVVYCKVVCRQIAHGEGFVAVTIIIALSLLVVLARSPILIERSGMSSLWTFFPLQMLSMHFCSLALRGLKAYAEM